MELTGKINKNLSHGRSIALVGPTDSGKTWYVKNELIPFLADREITAQYLDCGDPFDITDETDAVIIDEVETLYDKDFLERRHPEKKPDYTPGYLESMETWHKKIEKIKVPTVYIITRNEKEEIDYLVGNMKVTDWGRTVTCLKFTQK